METEKLSLSEIEDEIDGHQTLLASLPRFHPQRVEWLRSLAEWRFKISASHGQLDQLLLIIILQFTAALLLLLLLSWTGSTPPTALLLCMLADFLFICWTRFKRPDDNKYHAMLRRYLRRQRLQLVDTSHDVKLSYLVWGLGDQVLSGPRSVNAIENIKAMVIICLDLLNSDNPRLSSHALTALFSVMFEDYGTKRGFNDLAIECFREANIRLPDSPRLLFFLGHLLYLRFKEGFANGDYTEAIASLNRAIILASDLPEDIEDTQLIVGLSLWTIADLSRFRHSTFGKPEYLEEAINDHRTYLNSSWVPLDHPIRLDVSHKLTNLLDRRIRITPATHFRDRVDLSTISSLTASIPELNSWTSEQWKRHDDALLSIFNAVKPTSKIAVNEEVHQYCRQLVDSLRHDPSLNRLYMPSLPFLTLGHILVRAFKSTDKFEYLDESIAVLRDGFNMHCTRNEQQLLTYALLSPVSARVFRLCRREDWEVLIQLCVKIVDDTFEPEDSRFIVSHCWAIAAHAFNHPSATTAYERVFSLIQDHFSYPPTLEAKHSRLVFMRESFGDLPSNYASYQVKTGQLNKAIETLERGRAMLWSELRSFRTSTDRLAAVNLALAEEFVAINSELEQVTTSTVPYGIIQAEGSEGEGPGRIDPFGPIVVKRQKLLEDRERLISRIRALPDLQNFLKHPSFDELRSAALRGPVIIINHCVYRSDILILFHNSPPSLITTPDDFYRRTLELGNRLVTVRKKCSLESKQYQKALRSVLKDLYELVGRPVIEELRRTNIEEQSRVWWCPTSVFCHLPLHAMGPIPSDDRVNRYFSDLYISSYTPTLSALIEARKFAGGLGGKTSCRPSILLVAQPESLRYATPEIWTIQRLDATVTSLVSKMATPRSVVESLRHHQFSHFVCHGKLERGKPLEASLRLYRGERLTLLDIVRSRLPSAEFAFLSACHTAELTEESIDDEALHLTAAMQYCGFRSVVGTMWAMVDQGGQTLIKDFYKILLSSDEPGVPYHERSARALRDAVRNLRREGASLERWVNYVHYGA